MAERETSRDIDRAASVWAARLDRGPLSAEEERLFQTWLSGDPRRKGAMLRAQAVSMMSESAQALGRRFDPIDFEPPQASRVLGLSRRQALTWTGAGAAVAALAVLGASMPAGAVIRTRRGEVRLAPLEDGSTVLLNTESSVRVRYDKGERRVTLLGGEAYFSVARDDDRPFVVEVDGRRLRAFQAGFRVRRLEGAPVEVLVNQGRVDVSARDPAGSGVVALDGNTRLVLAQGFGSPGERPQPVAPEAITRELAWREGKLAFEGETLEQAAVAFARYSDTRIVIADQNLAHEPITGLFAANDPVGFSRAAARVFDARFKHEGGEVVLTRSAASHAPH